MQFENNDGDLDKVVNPLNTDTVGDESPLVGIAGAAAARRGKRMRLLKENKAAGGGSGGYQSSVKQAPLPYF